MHRRCDRPEGNRFQHYGGRGIGVDPRWYVFENFLEDMGERPLGPTRFTLDRIDSDGDYGLNNCRWATYGQQQRNYSKTILLTHNGKTQCLTDWAKEIGVAKSLLQSRYHRGLPTHEVLS
jgi:hypothetical protein